LPTGIKIALKKVGCRVRMSERERERERERQTEREEFYTMRLSFVKIIQRG